MELFIMAQNGHHPNVHELMNKKSKCSKSIEME
jgi:hypothetical protein